METKNNNMTTLYKLDSKNQIRVWQIEQYMQILTIRHGVLDGKLTTTYKHGKPTNVGKANEQSPAEHASSMMKSLIQAKIEKEGYTMSLENLNTDRTAPMLAQDANKQMGYIHQAIAEDDFVYVQPKLDGNRALCFIDGDSVTFKSRKGKVITTLDHLKKDALEFARGNWIDRYVVLDGEIYKHDKSLQEINSAVKKKNDLTENLEFVVYDKVEELHYWGRFLQYNPKACGLVKPINTSTASSLESLMSLVKDYEELGYEGAMIRTRYSKYECGKRSKHLLKLKSFEDAEFKIVGCSRIFYGTYKDCVMWQLKTEKGFNFEVLAGGTIEEKRNIDNPAQYIGKMATIKFHGRTDNGIPKFGVFKCFRD